MSDRSIDRHKSSRSYKSGYDKLVEKKEKEKKESELLSKTYRVTDFFGPHDHVSVDASHVASCTATFASQHLVSQIQYEIPRNNKQHPCTVS